MPDLLIELFSEEIPARMQARAADDLKKRMTDGLVEAGITYEAAAAFATPRRLTLNMTGVLAASPAQREERKGPRTDAPQKAIDGFLRATGLSLGDLEKRGDKKGETYFALIQKPGRSANEVVAEVLDQTIRNFPWPKSMRWGDGSLRWVRPLHSILAILSDEAGCEVVKGDIAGMTAGNTTEGHRFMAPRRFAVTSFDDYAAKLKSAFVELDPAARADTILAEAENMAFASGLELVSDKVLLAEVAGLVEWPVVLMGDIADDFLGLPAEVLQTSMREHQKFFSLRNPKTGRIEKFITVANRETADQGKTILAGNQKVLFARLSDAKFFWDNDLRIAKAGVQPWRDALQNVTFHNKLGSQADRISRIADLAERLAPLVGVKPEVARKAAEIAKTDLSSEMVYEFPELQGIMGRHYALKADFSPEIAAVCDQHYAPLGPTDAVPTAPLSVAVALADKLDLLAGFWAIDEKPTGSKDPFALRRAALGVIRIVLDNDLTLPLSGYANDDLISFFHDRLKVFLRDRGLAHDVIDAALGLAGNDDLALVVKRATALQDFLATSDGENLVQGFKRANNILSQAEDRDGVSYEMPPELKFAEDDAERALFAALDQAEEPISKAMAGLDFAAAMEALAGLRAPIDGFFEGVQVNSENEIVRRNRLCLLNRIRDVMGRVAAFEALEG